MSENKRDIHFTSLVIVVGDQLYAQIVENSSEIG